jgi:hypothetical protein
MDALTSGILAEIYFQYTEHTHIYYIFRNTRSKTIIDS